MAAAGASRKLIEAPGLAAAEAAVGLGFGPGSADDDAVPWDVVEQKLAELLRFLASAVQAVVAALHITTKKKKSLQQPNNFFLWAAGNRALYSGRVQDPRA